MSRGVISRDGQMSDKPKHQLPLDFNKLGAKVGNRTLCSRLVEAHRALNHECRQYGDAGRFHVAVQHVLEDLGVT